MLEVLWSGYIIPFFHPSLLTQIQVLFILYRSRFFKVFVLAQEVWKIFKKGVLQVFSDEFPGLCYFLFLVKKETGSWKPVIGLSLLSKFVQQTKFKKEIVTSILFFIWKNDFLAALDLYDAYFKIPSCHKLKQYICNIAFCHLIYVSSNSYSCYLLLDYFSQLGRTRHCCQHC